MEKDVHETVSHLMFVQMRQVKTAAKKKEKSVSLQ